MVSTDRSPSNEKYFTVKSVSLGASIHSILAHSTSARFSVTRPSFKRSAPLTGAPIRVKLVTHAEPAAGFRGSAARRGAVRSGAPPAAPGRFHRTEQAQGESVELHRSGEVVRRGHGSCAALRAAGVGEDHASGDHR